jgi:hypothetical protein
MGRRACRVNNVWPVLRFPRSRFFVACRRVEVIAVVGFDSLLPSDEWQAAGVHWHAFAEIRERETAARTADRARRRERVPDAVLRDPWAVAMWIDARTREHVHHREVYAGRDGVWVSIGDEEDLEHLRRENSLIASRGDSVYTDIYSENDHHDLYVEAVTDAQCTRGCPTKGAIDRSGD